MELLITRIETEIIVTTDHLPEVVAVGKMVGGDTEGSGTERDRSTDSK